jgi:cytoskeleton protein RodZ
MGEVNVVALSEIGGILRHKRQELGLEIPVISAEIKVKPHYLSAIENADTEMLKNAAYTIGYIKLYAGFLGVHIEEKLNVLKTKGNKISLIVSEDLVTDKNFIPSKWVVLFCIIAIVVIYAKFGG